MTPMKLTGWVVVYRFGGDPWIQAGLPSETAALSRATEIRMSYGVVIRVCPAEAIGLPSTPQENPK